jgi:hypothetical protein
VPIILYPHPPPIPTPPPPCKVHTPHYSTPYVCGVRASISLTGREGCSPPCKIHHTITVCILQGGRGVPSTAGSERFPTSLPVRYTLCMYGVSYREGGVFPPQLAEELHSVTVRSAVLSYPLAAAQHDHPTSCILRSDHEIVLSESLCWMLQAMGNQVYHGIYIIYVITPYGCTHHPLLRVRTARAVRCSFAAAGRQRSAGQDQLRCRRGA